MSRRRPLLVPLYAGMLALMLCLPSCFTTALWSTDDRDDGLTASEILGRAVLTPLAVILDLATLCAQEALFGEDDCDRACEQQPPCGPQRHR